MLVRTEADQMSAPHGSSNNSDLQAFFKEQARQGAADRVNSTVSNRQESRQQQDKRLIFLATCGVSLIALAVLLAVGLNNQAAIDLKAHERRPDYGKSLQFSPEEEARMRQGLPVEVRE